MSEEKRPYTFDRVVRIIVVVLSVCGVFYLLKLLNGALLPFVVAWFIAYMLNPVVLFFQHRCRIKNRLASIIITLFLLLSIVVGSGALLLPSIVSEVENTSQVMHSISQSHATGAEQQQAWYSSLLERVKAIDISSIIDSQEWGKILEKGANYIWSLLSGSFNQIVSIVGWFIVLLYLVFILIDYDNIIEGFKRLIPHKYRDITLEIMGDVEQGMNRYFRGQSIIALSVGVLFSIGFVIVGLPLAIPLGLFIGLLNMVPYLQVVGVIPTVVLCFLGSYSGDHSFWTLFGLSMVVFAVVQSIQDIYITPKVMGKVTGLNPAVILLSLSVWGTLMGVMGMIIALPLTSLLLAYYQKYILNEKGDR